MTSKIVEENANCQWQREPILPISVDQGDRRDFFSREALVRIGPKSMPNPEMRSRGSKLRDLC
jgi:hypothetical protein